MPKWTNRLLNYSVFADVDYMFCGGGGFTKRRRVNLILTSIQESDFYIARNKTLWLVTNGLSQVGSSYEL